LKYEILDIKNSKPIVFKDNKLKSRDLSLEAKTMRTYPSSKTNQVCVTKKTIRKLASTQVDLDNTLCWYV